MRSRESCELALPGSDCSFEDAKIALLEWLSGPTFPAEGSRRT